MKINTIVVRGICIHHEKVLIAHAIGAENTFLPGGHPLENESHEKALKRELYEELGIRIYECKYLGSIAHEFEWNQKIFSEVNEIYAFKIQELDKYNLLESKEKHLEFKWVSVHSISKIQLKPPLVVEWIHAMHPSLS